MLLGNFDIWVTKQHCDFFDRSASQKQFNRESIAKAMRVTVLDSWWFEKISETALPNAYSGVQLWSSGPEEMVVAQSRNTVQNGDDMIGYAPTIDPTINPDRASAHSVTSAATFVAAAWEVSSVKAQHSY
jgi:hypothetical protein